MAIALPLQHENPRAFFLVPENRIMSTIDRIHEKHDDTSRRNSFEAMTLRERLLGMLVVILLLILAILLQSL